jgi:hypothetical protein
VERTLIPSKQREVEVFVRARLAPEKEVKRLITASFGRGSRCGRRSSPGSSPVSPAVVELAGPGIDARWDDLTVEQRREIVRVLLHVVVLPSTRGRAARPGSTRTPCASSGASSCVCHSYGVATLPLGDQTGPPDAGRAMPRWPTCSSSWVSVPGWGKVAGMATVAGSAVAS